MLYHAARLSTIVYTIEVRRTEEFIEWVRDLRDRKAQSIINNRIVRIRNGNFGDVKYFDGIGEVRIDFGPGYRVYFQKRGAAIVILLCGGDKTTQTKDINAAIQLAKEYE